MTETFYRTGSHKVDRTRFGGIIYPSDFNTNYGDSNNIASRIARGWHFDRQCKLNAENRERNKRYGK